MESKGLKCCLETFGSRCVSLWTLAYFGHFLLDTRLLSMRFSEGSSMITLRYGILLSCSADFRANLSILSPREMAEIEGKNHRFQLVHVAFEVRNHQYGMVFFLNRKRPVFCKSPLLWLTFSLQYPSRIVRRVNGRIRYRL
jgi:hypothetical protein